MSLTDIIIAFLLGLSTSIGLVLLILKMSRRYGLAKASTEAHHSHTVPVPRLGGIALAGGMIVVVSVFTFLSGQNLFLGNQMGLVISASLAMFALGLLDDLFTLGARRKLLAQIFIASAAYFCGIGIYHFKVPITYEVFDLGLWSWPVTVLWLVGMTNLINLIDGVDGLAGGICLMLMGLLIFVSLQMGWAPVVGAGLAGALLGFLRFNFPPARIYMGDGGAYFLGFFIGCFTIISSQKGTIVAALIAPLFGLALPILDTALAILRRGLKGLPLFRADRKHIHHRLLQAGHSRRKVVLGLYIFTAFFLLLGLVIFCLHGQYFPVVLGLGTVVVISLAGSFSFSREWFSVGRVMGNSMEARSDIQYALCLSRWLALEGKRADTLEDLADDTAFIAQKLGFSTVWIRMEDEEKMWQLSKIPPENFSYYRHALPGQQNCFLKLARGRLDLDPLSPSGVSIQTQSISAILGDLLAEGWFKAVGHWRKRHGLPLRFDARPKVLAKVETPISETTPAGGGQTQLPVQF